MAKDKKSRASMREGPLSELFRRTEKGAAEGEAAEPTKAASPEEAQTDAGREPETRVAPTPQERLRSAFSSASATSPEGGNPVMAHSGLTAQLKRNLSQSCTVMSGTTCGCSLAASRRCTRTCRRGVSWPSNSPR